MEIHDGAALLVWKRICHHEWTVLGLQHIRLGAATLFQVGLHFI